MEEDECCNGLAREEGEGRAERKENKSRVKKMSLKKTMTLQFFKIHIRTCKHQVNLNDVCTILQSST